MAACPPPRAHNDQLNASITIFLLRRGSIAHVPRPASRPRAHWPASGFQAAAAEDRDHSHELHQHEHTHPYECARDRGQLRGPDGQGRSGGAAFVQVEDQRHPRHLPGVWERLRRQHCRCGGRCRRNGRGEGDRPAEGRPAEGGPCPPRRQGPITPRSSGAHCTALCHFQCYSRSK